MRSREEVVVRHEDERLELGLEANPVGERSHIVPKVKRSGRPITREHSRPALDRRRS